MGHLIPAGTGFHTHRKLNLVHEKGEEKIKEDVLTGL